MNWTDVANAIGSAAPAISSVLAATGVGAPAAGAVSAIGAVAKAFGKDESASPDEIMEAIQADPEALVKLKVAEMDYKLELREKEIEKMRVQMTPYLKELSTRTVPWVDAMHKMGRQFLNFYTVTIVTILLWGGHAITPEAAALIGGPNMIYQFIKGKGKETV